MEKRTRFVVDAGEQTEVDERLYKESILQYTYGVPEKKLAKLTDKEINDLYEKKSQ